METLMVGRVFDVVVKYVALVFLAIFAVACLRGCYRDYQAREACIAAGGNWKAVNYTRYTPYRCIAFQK